MQIHYSSLHNLDMGVDDPIRKAIPADFNSYMKAYIEFATKENDSSREYTVIDANRTVMNCVTSMYSDLIRHPEGGLDLKIADELSDSIARKLLDTERAVQERVGQMTNVQKGSIVQALTLSSEGYKFVIAKVEHSEWYDGETLLKNFGFPSENKRVWKSAVIELESTDENIIFKSIKCYINNNAKYWTADFLEVQEAKDDTTNTRAVYAAVEKVLKPIKESSLQDYYNLRNSFVRELQTEQVINYSDMVERLVGDYSPSLEQVNASELKNALLVLKDAGKFDTQFHTDPKVMKRNKKTSVPVSAEIEVLIKEGLPNWEGNFLICKKTDGRNYLMIRCTNPKTLSAFPLDRE